MRGRIKTVMRYVLALFMINAGSGHFTNTEFFVANVPPYLPAPLALVYISGVLEILGGLGLLRFDPDGCRRDRRARRGLFCSSG